MTRFLTTLIALALLLPACSFRPTQDPETTLIRWDGLEQRPRTDAVAGHYVRYALMALAAYDEKIHNDDSVTFSRRVVPALGAWDGLKTELGALPISVAMDWLDGWKRITENVEKIGPDGKPGYERAIGGLGVHLWYKPGDCSEFVVAFRGTNFREAADWYSNLRWITRILPGYDQYQQVRDNIKKWVADLSTACPKDKTPRIVAVGHSLGGGLAQQAAYAHRPVCHVLAFDPSFVTGYYSTKDSDRNAEGLVIDRAYEHGEILAYLRFLIRQVYPASATDPAIRTVRFDFVDRGSIFDQHSMMALTAGLIKAAGSPEQWRAKSKAAIIGPSTGPDCPSRHIPLSRRY